MKQLRIVVPTAGLPLVGQDEELELLVTDWEGEASTEVDVRNNGIWLPLELAGGAHSEVNGGS